MVPRQSSLYLTFLIVMGMAGFVWAQTPTQPTPQSLPYTQNFGTVGFSTLPAGMAAWNGMTGSSITSATDAASSSPSGDAPVNSATSTQTTGGCYGFGASGNGRFYIQTSSSAPNGVNQLVLAINTSGQTSLVLSYDVEMVVAAPTRTIGVLCQYRVGTSGAWTNLTASSGLNPFSQAGGGSPGVKTSPQITLPVAAENRPVVQIRWTTWRGNGGTESGTSSGIGIDNVAVTPASVRLSVSVVPSSISEGAGANATTLTVTRDGDLSAALPVTLAISDATEAAYDGPNPLSIPAGQASVTFPIRAVDDEEQDGTQIVTLTATALNAAPGGTPLSVLDDEDPYSPPAGYYQSASGLTGTALKSALKIIASPANYHAYDYGDTYAPIRVIHEDPNNNANVLLVYSGTSLGKNVNYYPGGPPADSSWSREHVWPESYGLDPDNVNPGSTGGDAGADFTDLFNLWPCFQTVNAQRSNRYYDNTSGTGTVPSLAPLCSYDTDSWEPRAIERGDLARVIFYMATRYDGTDPLTMDLEIVNPPANSTTAGRFARLSTLLRWNEEDPVSADERRRNQTIFANYQHNRNPFVDHPEYIAAIWGGVNQSKTTASVTEGGATDSYTISLAAAPTADVTITLSSTPSGQVTVAPSSLTFTSANWDQPQTVTITAVNDTVHESTLTATIQHVIGSSDTRYNALAASDVVVTVQDNDLSATLLVNYGGPWNPLPTGFVGSNMGSPYGSSLGDDSGTGSAKFDATGSRLKISFNSAPATLSYRLLGNPANGSATVGTFLVQQSTDGVNFTTLRTVTNKDNTDQLFSDALSSATRSVAFLYSVKTGGNIQLDQLAITAATPLVTWASSFGLNDASAAPLVDYDSDGWVNLLEYALGGSPVAAESASFQPVLQYSAGALQMTIVVRSGDPSLSMVVQTTSTLQNSGSWTTTGVSELTPIDQTGIAVGFVRRVFQVASPSPTGQFMHVVFGAN